MGSLPVISWEEFLVWVARECQLNYLKDLERIILVIKLLSNNPKEVFPKMKLWEVSRQVIALIDLIKLNEFTQLELQKIGELEAGYQKKRWIFLNQLYTSYNQLLKELNFVDKIDLCFFLQDRLHTFLPLPFYVQLNKATEELNYLERKLWLELLRVGANAVLQSYFPPLKICLWRKEKQGIKKIITSALDAGQNIGVFLRSQRELLKFYNWLVDYEVSPLINKLAESEKVIKAGIKILEYIEKTYSNSTEPKDAYEIRALKAETGEALTRLLFASGKDVIYINKVIEMTYSRENSLLNLPRLPLNSILERVILLINTPCVALRELFSFFNIESPDINNILEELNNLWILPEKRVPLSLLPKVVEEIVLNNLIKYREEGVKLFTPLSLPREPVDIMLIPFFNSSLFPFTKRRIKLFTFTFLKKLGNFLSPLKASPFYLETGKIIDFLREDKLLFLFLIKEAKKEVILSSAFEESGKPLSPSKWIRQFLPGQSLNKELSKSCPIFSFFNSGNREISNCADCLVEICSKRNEEEKFSHITKEPLSAATNEEEPVLTSFFTLSPHRFNLYFTCPLKFYFNLILPDKEKSDSIVIGELVHIVMDRINSLPRKERTLNKALKFLEEEGKSKAKSFSSLLDYLLVTKKLAEVFEEYFSEHFPQKEVLGVDVPSPAGKIVEFPFCVSIGENLVKGRIDLVCKKEEDGIEILDYKTKIKASAIPKTIKFQSNYLRKLFLSPKQKEVNFQLPIYYWAILNTFPQFNIKELSFCYFCLFGQEKVVKLSLKVDETITREELRRVIEDLKDISSEIKQSKKFLPKPSSEVCNSCSYSEICLC